MSRFHILDGTYLWLVLLYLQDFGTAYVSVQCYMFPNQVKDYRKRLLFFYEKDSFHNYLLKVFWCRGNFYCWNLLESH